MEKRVLQNPMVKNKFTLIKTSEQTNGDYVLVEIEMSPGGSNTTHYHKSFSEEFIPVQGALAVQIAGKLSLVRPGQRIRAKEGQHHRFFNPGKKPIRFQIKMTPGNDNFINSLLIAYGLAHEGKTTKQGIPKKLDHLAILVSMLDIHFTGLLSLIQPFLNRRAKKARKKGVEKELISRYCTEQMIAERTPV
jgi:mannose-6-phosphate isomerase-like protein (cupin superfamily)